MSRIWANSTTPRSSTSLATMAQCRRHAGWYSERVCLVQWLGFSGPGSAQGFLQRLGKRPYLSAHGGAMDMGIRHTVLMNQADRIALRWRAPGDGDLVAQDDQDKGGLRNQFHHMIDIVPTILE